MIPCPLPHFMGSLRKSKEKILKASISSCDRGRMRVLWEGLVVGVSFRDPLLEEVVPKLCESRRLRRSVLIRRNGMCSIQELKMLERGQSLESKGRTMVKDLAGERSRRRIVKGFINYFKNLVISGELCKGVTWWDFPWETSSWLWNRPWIEGVGCAAHESNWLSSSGTLNLPTPWPEWALEKRRESEITETHVRGDVDRP